MNWRGRHDVKAHTVHLNHKERVRSISITNPVQTSSTRELCARKLDLVPTSFSPYVTTMYHHLFFLFDFNADLDACNGKYGVYNNDKVTWFKMVGRWQKNNMIWASIYRMELVSCLQFVVIIIITHLCRSGAWMCSSYSLSLYQKHLWLEKKNPRNKTYRKHL